MILNNSLMGQLSKMTSSTPSLGSGGRGGWRYLVRVLDHEESRIRPRNAVKRSLLETMKKKIS